MKFDKTDVSGFESALRGMRNPLESWEKSDSKYDSDSGSFIIGENDLVLAMRLVKGGSEHRKFLRQIAVWVDITAPLYWWKEMDTYKIGITANSTSTMHKLSATPITMECFETDDYDGDIGCLSPGCDKCSDYSLHDFITRPNGLLDMLEHLRLKYLETKDKRYWKELIRWLPESWLQTRTMSMNYENVLHIYMQRKGHKLTEWESFCRWAEDLPHFKDMCLLPLGLI